MWCAERLHHGVVLLYDELRGLLHDVPPHQGTVCHQTLHHLQHVRGILTQMILTTVITLMMMLCSHPLIWFLPPLFIPLVVLSGGGPPVFIFWPGHPGCSVLDGHGTKREEESTYRRNSSLPHGCALRLYPHWEWPWIVFVRPLKETKTQTFLSDVK